MDTLTQLENAYPGASCSIHVTCYDYRGEKRKTHFIHVHLPPNMPNQPADLLKFQGDSVDEAVEKALRHPLTKPSCLQRVIEDIYELTEACADGAPDANSHDKLANFIAHKLAPFIPTHKR
jgi:hypothetical protein